MLFHPLGHSRSSSLVDLIQMISPCSLYNLKKKKKGGFIQHYNEFITCTLLVKSILLWKLVDYKQEFWVGGCLPFLALHCMLG